jgi:hypothetical protein
MGVGRSTADRVKAPNGRTVAPTSPPRSTQIASGSLRTLAEINELSLAVTLDLLSGTIEPSKNCAYAARWMGNVLRGIELQHRCGGDYLVVGGVAAEPEEDPLDRRRRELFEELAAIDKERSAK